VGFKDTYTIRCAACRTKNRIPAEKIDTQAKCGKCGAYLETGVLFSGQPVMVSDGNFEKEVLKSPLPVLLFCWATWCATCKTSMPVIDDFAKNAKGRVRVAKLNVDGSPSLSAKYNILSLPYILVFENGRLKEEFPGALPKHDIMMKMAAYI
jgi:thioredoxin 2